MTMVSKFGNCCLFCGLIVRLESSVGVFVGSLEGFGGSVAFVARFDLVG